MTHPLPTIFLCRAAAVLSAVFVLCALGACGRKEQPPRRLTIAYSNDMWGEIRSCGCAVHDRGGLGRRATFLSELRDTTGGDMLVVESGDFFGAGINYGVEKADVTLKSMALMNYDAVAIGEDDLGFGLDYLRRRVRETNLPVVVCNLFKAGTDSLIFAPSRVVTTASGLRVGIAGAMGSAIAFPPQVPAGTLEIRDPVQSLQPVVDAMRPDVDAVVVLAHMARGDAQRMCQALHGVDIVFHGHEGKPMRQVRRFGEPYLLETTGKGLYMGVAYATLGPDGRVADLQNAVVPMDQRYEDDEAIAKLFMAYDFDIAAKERATLPTGVTNVKGRMKDPFQGAEACQACHESIYQSWQGTRHAHAWDTLTGLKREFDRDCTPCHSVGFYKKGGFENVVATPHLTGVQCESCHGNAARHVQDPSVKPEQENARALCQGCHTTEQSPDFEVEAFWQRIDHGRDGAAKGN